MLKIGLTGGIGSGKSQVATLLEEWGATIVDTDLVAHQLCQPGGFAIAAIAEQFGSAFITAEQGMDRQRMREHVFANPAERQRLEALLHPLIWDEARRQVMSAGGLYVVVVVPLLIERGRWRNHVDRICVVDCDEHTQKQRVRERSGLTDEVIERIMGAQATREQRLAVADDVIVNDGKTTLSALRQQAEQLHQQWLQQR
ncbi:dephospho-CoA kinase [Paenalcaligenes sp. Me52]|uniref:dephospho-CoA kinase n=1 Tax=Paenalcaligenes sp. Me52 TaxID=3392038 RepID=UPI003D2B81DC